MALPKHLRRIDQRLSRIEEKLGIEDEGAQVVTKGIKTAPETPEQVAARLDFKSYSAKEVIERVESLNQAERQALAEFERANENRVTVLRALEG